MKPLAPSSRASWPGLSLGWAIFLISSFPLASTLGWSRTAWALECDPDALCTTDPCTIVGTHYLEPDCDLDFGEKSVTLDATSALLPARNSSFYLSAGDLNIRGMISGVGIYSGSIIATRNIITGPQSIISLRGVPVGLYGYALVSGLSMYADGTIELQGARVESNGLYLSIEAESIHVASRLVSNVNFLYEGIGILLWARSGDVIVESPLESRPQPSRLYRGQSYGRWGNVEISAEGNVEIGSTIRAAGRIDIVSGGTVHASRQLRARIPPSGYMFSPGLSISAAQDVLLDKDVSAESAPAYSSFGTIDVSAGRDLVIKGKMAVKVNETDDGFSGTGISLTAGRSLVARKRIENQSRNGNLGTIEIGPACDVTLDADVKTKLSEGHTNTIRYVNSLAIVGSQKLHAGSGGINRILCACEDPNFDSICDSGCRADPIGLAQLNASPPASLVPTAFPHSCP